MPLHVAPPSHAPQHEPYEAATHLAPVRDFVYGQQHPPLMDQNINHINTNETKVDATTVLEHVKDTYTPGDRLGSSRPRPKKSPQRRQAPRPGGFPCEVDTCDKTFDRACDFNRHQKTHLGRSERPHKCSACRETFLYPKDLERHQQKHINEPSARTLFQCRQPGCCQTFSRRDNLLRHQRRQHSGLTGATPP
ncbi:hypothetical protein NX059_004256 [Plenodomus lindquistii]|nr:hypothetical protein NX059_004256 [Plenodomus lindquistii]